MQPEQIVNLSNNQGVKRVLLIAPQPFFAERGTPLNVRALAESLSQIGFYVDLLVYPIGTDICCECVKIHRGFRVPGICDVPVGPSWRKVVLDMTLFIRGLFLILSRRYVLIHGIEEGAFIAGIFGLITRTPYVVDVDSCMCDQLEHSGFIRSRFILKIFSQIEKFFMCRASGVLTVCSALTNKVKEVTKSVPIHQIEDFPLPSSCCVDPQRVQELREQFNLSNKRVIVYTGNFLPYQGLDLLRDAFMYFWKHCPYERDVVLLLVGGDVHGDPLVDKFRQIVAEAGLSDAIKCTGHLPMSEMGNVMALADVLVSPRCDGGNTPLKIYTYMASGRPILATRLETHTQVLDDKTALLASPDAEGFGRAMIEAFEPSEAVRAKLDFVGKEAKELVQKNYSKESFVRRVEAFYSEILQ